jgi:hypothetical protein
MSNAHQKLGCNVCHTPISGVSTKACVTCHVGTDFGNVQSTQFHAAATQCVSCHVEHEGDRGIVQMDHAVLLAPELWHRGHAAATPVITDKISHASLDCASCHSIRDRHLGLFGRDCAACHLTGSWKIAGYRHPRQTRPNAPNVINHRPAISWNISAWFHSVPPIPRHE